jgi:DNA invertase Pin-like site-specific DNA recombinase
MRKSQITPPPDRHKIGYARVSTTEQSLDMQIAALKRYGVNELHVEKVSTRKSRREKLEHAISEIREGDVFVVWRLDRIGRSVDDLLALVGRITAAGADLVSLTETIDMTTPGGKMMFHMFCAFAQFERDIISERTSTGMKEWIAKGGKPGRKPVLDAAKSQTVLDMLNAGETKTATCKAVKCSVTTINNYFEYAGRPKAWRKRKTQSKK